LVLYKLSFVLFEDSVRSEIGAQGDDAMSRFDFKSNFKDDSRNEPIWPL